MHAIKPSRSPLQPLEPKRRAPRHRRQNQKRHRHRASAVEAATKLTANLVLSVAFASALVKLLPYNQTQQKKLHEIRAEVQAVDKRVQQLQHDFGVNFDPRLVLQNIEEQTHLSVPGRNKIIFRTPDDTVAE